MEKTSDFFRSLAETDYHYCGVRRNKKEHLYAHSAKEMGERAAKGKGTERPTKQRQPGIWELWRAQERFSDETELTDTAGVMGDAAKGKY